MFQFTVIFDLSHYRMEEAHSLCLDSKKPLLLGMLYDPFLILFDAL